MKFETLIARYKNLGYEPKGLEPEIELEFLISWIYKTYDRFIWVQYFEHSTQKSFKNHIPEINYFLGAYVHSVHTDHSNKYFGDKYFSEPFDAKFDIVRHMYSSLKFNYGKNYEK